MRTCPECGGPLPEDILDGLCPRCVVRVAIAGPDEDAPEPSTGEPGGQATTPAMPEAVSAGPNPIPPPPTVGTKVRYFGDYELIAEIDHGGMGVVWKARQVSLDRVVALKMILAGPFATEEFIKRFEIEAKAAAQLQHPNIVAIHEVGQHEGQHYYSMDYVEGSSLAALVREKPLPPKQAARYVQIVAEAIHYAHQHHILHRDLKPANVLVDWNDQPRITDFGLAKRLDVDSGLESTERTFGTLGYMPPEQVETKRGAVGPHSDVYSLGATLYHLLTGRPPFQGDWGVVLEQVRNADPVSPRQLNPSVPKDLETICLQCLRKEPKGRYATAQELADDLGRWQRGEPIHARTVTVVERTVKWVRRKPVIASLAAGIILVAILGFTVWLVKDNELGGLISRSSEYLVQQTFQDANNMRGALLLKELDRAIKRHPIKFDLWYAKATVLGRTNRLDEAVDAISRAIDLARPDQKTSAATIIEMLLYRSSVNRQRGRQSEADADYYQAGLLRCQGSGFPLRDPRAKSTLLDLSLFYNVSYWGGTWSGTNESNTAASVAEEVRRTTGVEFDVRGHIRLESMGRRRDSDGARNRRIKFLPTSVLGIPVNRRFAQVHILQGAIYHDRVGAKIGVYVFHYANGHTEEFPIIYGEDVRSMEESASLYLRRQRGLSMLQNEDARFGVAEGHRGIDAMVAWTGEGNKKIDSVDVARFYTIKWHNPWPELEVKSLDFLSTMSQGQPFLVALTVEAAESDSPEYALTRAKELEEQRDVAGALATLSEAIQRHGGNLELWYARGVLLEKTTRLDEAIQSFAKAIEVATTNASPRRKALPALWNAKGMALEKAGRHTEAVLAFSQSIELANGDPKTFAAPRKAALWHRSDVYDIINEPKKAEADRLAARGILPRDPQTRPELLDLTTFYTTGLSEALMRWGVTKADEVAKAMAGTMALNTGVPFDARGLVECMAAEGTSTNANKILPAAKGIPVHRRVTCLHAVHSLYGAMGQIAPDTRVGAYVLHYANGRTHEFPILYDRHLKRLTSGPKFLASEAMDAWSCEVTGGTNAGLTVRLFKVTWTNPHPELEVSSLDFISIRSNGAPFLVAITVDESNTVAPSAVQVSTGTSVVGTSQLKYQTAREVSVTLGSINLESGLQQIEWDDGLTAPARLENQECRSLLGLAETQSDPKYLYFKIDPTFKLHCGSNVTVEVEYFDAARGSFDINYDGPQGAYTRSPDSATLRQTRQWLRANFPLKNARFNNSQNGRADFRLGVASSEFFVRRVAVLRSDAVEAQTPPTAPAPSQARPGYLAPSFKLDLLDGGQVDLADHQGSNIVILDFWATWNADGRQSMPVVAEVASEYAGKGVVHYAVNLSDSPDTIRSFLKETGLKVQVALDQDGKVGELYRIEGIPTTVVIGKDGRFQTNHVQTGHELKDRLKEELELLLAGKVLAEPVALAAIKPAAPTALPLLEAIPQRDPSASGSLINLDGCYNACFTKGWIPPLTPDRIAGYGLTGLKPGIYSFDGVHFDVRGVIQLQGTALRDERGATFPEAVHGIKVGHKCQRLNFLHSTSWGASEGEKIARYVIHYADAREFTIPILYGDDLVTWFKWPVKARRAVTAWTGTNGASHHISLFKSEWQNPRPEVAIESIDFVSMMTQASPFLVAITAEP